MLRPKNGAIQQFPACGFRPENMLRPTPHFATHLRICLPNPLVTAKAMVALAMGSALR